MFETIKLNTFAKNLKRFATELNNFQANTPSVLVK